MRCSEHARSKPRSSSCCREYNLIQTTLQSPPVSSIESSTPCPTYQTIVIAMADLFNLLYLHNSIKLHCCDCSDCSAPPSCWLEEEISMKTSENSIPLTRATLAKTALASPRLPWSSSQERDSGIHLNIAMTDCRPHWPHWPHLLPRRTGRTRAAAGSASWDQ